MSDDGMRKGRNLWHTCQAPLKQTVSCSKKWLWFVSL